MKSLIATHVILQDIHQCIDKVGDYLYALHIPALDKSWIGLQCSQIVTYSLGEFVVSDRSKLPATKLDTAMVGAFKEVQSLPD